jgi:hypothetical protein
VFVTVKGKVYTDTSGVCTEIPVTLTPAGVLEPLVDYFLLHWRDRSVAWMGKVSRSVRMFLEYLVANPDERDSHILFRNFANRLYTGTFNRAAGLDPSGLCWSALSYNDASHIITHLTDFFDWLCRQRPDLRQFNPRYAGSVYDRITDETAYQFRRSRALLGHTWADSAPSGRDGHVVRPARLPRVERIDPPRFPDERFEELLVKGFRVGGRYDLRGILITLLLHGAGFRESEPFHLYASVSDVFHNPSNRSEAMVLIHHPSLGYAPSDDSFQSERTKTKRRAEYLAREFGLIPRDKLMDSRRAGWKGGTHDGEFYKRAYWFLPQYGEWFMQLWPRYLEQVARLDRSHPFAFINLHHEPIGNMYTLAQYNKAHAAACERIGLTVSKELGTTPHGHRHAYGHRLRKAGIKEDMIRRFMHHASLESQRVYTEATLSETLAELGEGMYRLAEKRVISSIPRSILLPGVDSGE